MTGLVGPPASQLRICLTVGLAGARLSIATGFTIESGYWAALSKRDRSMPIDPKDVPIFAPDFVEFLAAFITMIVSMVILVVLGNWWAR